MLSGLQLMDILDLKRGKIYGGAMIYERSTFPMYITDINDMFEIKIKLRRSLYYDKKWLYYDLETMRCRTSIGMTTYDNKLLTLKRLYILDITELEPDDKNDLYVNFILKGFLEDSK
jgi:hypothetical protein